MRAAMCRGQCCAFLTLGVYLGYSIVPLSIPLAAFLLKGFTVVAV